MDKLQKLANFLGEQINILESIATRNHNLEVIVYDQMECTFEFQYLVPISKDEDGMLKIIICEDDLGKLMVSEGWIFDYNISTGAVITNEMKIDHIEKFIWYMEARDQNELFNLIKQITV